MIGASEQQTRDGDKKDTAKRSQHEMTLEIMLEDSAVGWVGLINPASFACPEMLGRWTDPAHGPHVVPVTSCATTVNEAAPMLTHCAGVHGREIQSERCWLTRVNQ